MVIRKGVNTSATVKPISNSRQPGIQHYTRVTKSSTQLNGVEASISKCISDGNPYNCDFELAHSSRPIKRKLALSDDGSSSSDETNGLPCELLRKKRKTMKQLQRVGIQEVERKEVYAGSMNPQTLPTPEITPKKPCRTRDCFPQQHVSSSPSRIYPAETETCSETDTEHGQDIALPSELVDLAGLHASFLRALSLQLAHGGPASPIDLRQLAPSISSLWRTRTVTILDIRRIVGTLHSAQDQDQDQDRRRAKLSTVEFGFVLFDYGGGRICIERAHEEQNDFFLARHLDEDALNGLCKEQIHRRWELWLGDNPGSKTDDLNDVMADFISQLPLADTPMHPSVKDASPLMLTGQRRLAILKSAAASAARISMADNKRTVTSKLRASSDSVLRSRKELLLERIKSKEASQAILSARLPTRGSLTRQAALHRLPAIVPMLSILCGSTDATTPPRQTFSLHSLVQRVQDSSRSPLSREEIVDCLSVLANEFAADWVRMVNTGGSVTGVVIDTRSKPADGELERRRMDALAAT